MSDGNPNFFPSDELYKKELRELQERTLQRRRGEAEAHSESVDGWVLRTARPFIGGGPGEGEEQGYLGSVLGSDAGLGRGAPSVVPSWLDGFVSHGEEDVVVVSEGEGPRRFPPWIPTAEEKAHWKVQGEVRMKERRKEKEEEEKKEEEWKEAERVVANMKQRERRHRLNARKAENAERAKSGLPPLSPLKITRTGPKKTKRANVQYLKDVDEAMATGGEVHTGSGCTAYERGGENLKVNGKESDGLADVLLHGRVDLTGSKRARATEEAEQQRRLDEVRGGESFMPGYGAGGGEQPDFSEWDVDSPPRGGWDPHAFDHIVEDDFESGGKSLND